MQRDPATKIVRFAPSPTGHLHIGSVRTALFNYLFVKSQDGKLILRIEDTDISRSSESLSEEIIKGLQWLEIKWDMGPFYQSDHFVRYKETSLRLLEQGKAYRCFCTPQEIEARRINSWKKNKSERIFKYDRRCLNLTQGEINEKLGQNIPFVIRFRIPEGITYFKDRIHKEMKTNNSELEDFVILKSDNSSTYHLSVVKDDSDMEITDVIRGDDHISNTFKQVLLFKALGLKPPNYAHLPLILGPDKKKLSKRHGETSLLEFKKNGYLPEAIITYLSQLSWIPADSKKIFSMNELANQFSFMKLSKNNPVFDYNKLRFLNGQAIKHRDSEELYNLMAEDEAFERKFDTFEKEKKIALIELIKPRMKTLADFKEKFEIYLHGKLNYDNKNFQKFKKMFFNTNVKQYLKLFLLKLKVTESFDVTSVEECLRDCAKKNSIKAADLIHPARFALIAETVSPSIFALFAFFGKEESIKRINCFIDYLEKLDV